MPFWAVTAIAVAQAWKQPDTVVVEQRKERLARPGHEGAKQTRSYPPITHWRGMWGIAKDTVSKWSEDKAPQLGASLAYYTLFSLVPLLIIVIAIAGVVFGQEAAQGQIVQQLGALMGEQSSNALQFMIEKARSHTKGVISAIIGVATLLAGASGVFGELQDAVNRIWGVAPRPGRGIWATIRQRFLSYLAVLGTGFLLLVSLVISAALATLGQSMPSILPVPEFLLEALNSLVSLAVITMLFAMIFKWLPDAKIAWRDVWIGSIATAILFTIGKFAIGYYLGKSDIASTYGAAASIVVILLWIYYSSQLVLLGAEFTAVYASRYGSRITPTPDAVAVDEPALSGQAAG